MNETGNEQDISAEAVPLWTYFIRGADAIKIGQSKYPRARLTDLQSANGSKLELMLAVPYSQMPEPDAHLKFRHLRIHREWFRPEQELLDFIAKLKAETRKPRRLVRPPASKRVPPTPVDAMIGRLTAARPSAPAHKRNHISNLIEQLRNHSKETDPRIRAFLEGAMARSMTHIEAA